MDEVEIIERLKKVFASPGADNLLVGIGDDAAFFRPRSEGVAIATDLLTEGVHFDRRWSGLYSIGRKAAAANLADIFAMGIPATYLVVAVAFDPKDGDGILDLAQGIADESALAGASVIGGDLSRASQLTISIAALGEGEQVVTRDSAQPGDDLFLVDLPGRSLLGLEQLRRDIRVDEASMDFHREPKINYRAFLDAAESATSLCDISDGILSDARNLARASGVGIDLDQDAMLAHPSADSISTLATKLGMDPVMAILASGEEHGALFTAKRDVSVAGAWRIGSVVEGRGEYASLTLDGRQLSGRGFSHF